MKPEFHRRFIKELSRLPRSQEERFYERLTLFLSMTDHPQLSRHPLRGKYIGHWSIDISGDIRAAYKIQDKTYFFIHIGTHHQLYGN